MKVVLMELRESGINLRIIIEKPILQNEKVQIAHKESNELMAIYFKRVETAKQNKISSTFKFPVRPVHPGGLITNSLFLI